MTHLPKQKHPSFRIQAYLFALIIIGFIWTNKRKSKRAIAKELHKLYSEHKVIKKGHLIRAYGVDKKTFFKWLEYFAPKFQDFKRKRKLSWEEQDYLYTVLGSPDENLGAMSKQEIALHCGSDIKVLRDNILLNPKAYGLTKESYNSLTKFPPTICKRIILNFN